MPGARFTVGLAQIAPVWLDRDATIDKVVGWIEKSAAEGCSLVVFGEALIPGYPFWLSGPAAPSSNLNCKNRCMLTT